MANVVVVGAQWGGRILDSRGAKPATAIGAALAAVGFFLWAGQVSDIEAGLGGLLEIQADTDACAIGEFDPPSIQLRQDFCQIDWVGFSPTGLETNNGL